MINQKKSFEKTKITLFEKMIQFHSTYGNHYKGIMRRDSKISRLINTLSTENTAVNTC